MNFSKEIKQAWAIMIGEICFVAIGGINVGFGIFRQMSGLCNFSASDNSNINHFIACFLS